MQTFYQKWWWKENPLLTTPVKVIWLLDGYVFYIQQGARITLGEVIKKQIGSLGGNMP